MADTWREYFAGTPEQQAADQVRRQQEYDRITSSPLYQSLRARSDRPMELNGRVYDPRELRMAAVADTIMPSPETDFGNDIAGAGRATVGAAYPAYQYVFEAGMRPRDTVIKAAQAFSQGDPMIGASLLARAPVSAFYPPAAAGTPGSPDDWRKDAERLGVAPGNIMAIDLLTDPETYMPIPIQFHAARQMGRLAGPAMRSARALDEAGDMIRQLKAAR